MKTPQRRNTNLLKSIKLVEDLISSEEQEYSCYNLNILLRIRDLLKKEDKRLYRLKKHI